MPASLWTRVFAAAGLVTVLAVLGLFATRMSADTTSRSAESRGPTEPTVLVEIGSVTVGSITESIQAVGTLQAGASIIVRPEIPGVIRRIDFSDGQSVERAAPLIELDQEELQAQANQAAAQEKIAHVTYERLKRLSGQQTTIVPAQQVDEARLALQAAAANSLLYAVRLKKSVIRAPFAGTLGLRRVSVGDYVQPGQDLVNLEDLRSLHVDFKVPESYLSRVTTGQQVLLSTDAYPDRTFTGEVYAVDPRVDATNRAVAVRARLPNEDETLRPGLFATATLVLASKPDALLLPEEAVVHQQGGTFVYRVVDETARLVEITLGRREVGRVQVLSGLQPGERVVLAGHQKLKDGSRVATQ